MENWANYVGYLASVFIVGGFIFKNLRTIRLLNMVGCLCFVIFGFFSAQTPLWPIIIPNGLLALVQIYYLIFVDKKSN